MKSIKEVSLESTVAGVFGDNLKIFRQGAITIDIENV